MIQETLSAEPEKYCQRHFFFEEGELGDFGGCLNHWSDDRAKSRTIKRYERDHGLIFRSGRSIFDLNVDEEYLNLRTRILDFFGPFLTPKQKDRFVNITDRYEVILVPSDRNDGSGKFWFQYELISTEFGKSPYSIAWTMESQGKKVRERGVLIVINSYTLANQAARKAISNLEYWAMVTGEPEGHREQEKTIQNCQVSELRDSLVHELIHHLLASIGLSHQLQEDDLEEGIEQVAEFVLMWEPSGSHPLSQKLSPALQDEARRFLTRAKEYKRSIRSRNKAREDF